jgi:glutathione S-transferase
MAPGRTRRYEWPTREEAAMELYLYYVPNTRAVRVRWMLEELGVPYELRRVNVSAGEHRTDAYKKIHPLSHVPALVDGEVTMFESGAIVLYLADKFIDKELAPPPGSPLRAAYYQWFAYALTELEPHLNQISLQRRLPEAQRQPVVTELGRAGFHKNVRALEEALADGREFLVGGRFSAADLIVGSMVGWASFMGLVEEHPTLLAWWKRLSARPAAQRARAD